MQVSQHLVLFLTQGEGGAPGYLSPLGEDAASSLAETLAAFFEGLNLNLGSGVDGRAKALEALAAGGEGQRGLGLEGAAIAGATMAEALSSAVRICPDVLVCSGPSVRSRRTLGPLVEHLALPVLLVEELDGGGPERTLAAGLERLFAGGIVAGGGLPGLPAQSAASSQVLPRLVVLQISLTAFSDWLPAVLDPSTEGQEMARAMIAALRDVTEGDKVPGLVALGFEGPWPGRWILDGDVADAAAP